MSSSYRPGLSDNARVEILRWFGRYDSTLLVKTSTPAAHDAAAKAMDDQDWGEMLRLADAHLNQSSKCAVYTQLFLIARKHPAGDAVRSAVYGRLSSGCTCGSTFIATSARNIAEHAPDDLLPEEIQQVFMAGHPDVDIMGEVWRAMIKRGFFPDPADVRAIEAGVMNHPKLLPFAAQAFAQFQTKALEEELADARHPASRATAPVTGGL